MELRAGMRWALGAMLAAAATSAAVAQNKVVNVYNWAEYTAPDTIPGFEKETGIKVRYDVYDSSTGTWQRGLGNLTAEIHWGNQYGQGARTVSYQYAAPGASFVAGKPGVITVYAGASASGTPLAQTVFTYDGASAWSTSPTRGLLTGHLLRRAAEPPRTAAELLDAAGEMVGAQLYDAALVPGKKHSTLELVVTD